jgi:hypothetical protein
MNKKTSDEIASCVFTSRKMPTSPLAEVRSAPPVHTQSGGQQRTLCSVKNKSLRSLVSMKGSLHFAEDGNSCATKQCGLLNKFLRYLRAFRKGNNIGHQAFAQMTALMAGRRIIYMTLILLVPNDVVRGWKTSSHASHQSS